MMADLKSTEKVEMNRITVNFNEKTGKIKPIIADHIGTPYHHKGSAPERLAAMGYIPAYDGMVIEV